MSTESLFPLGLCDSEPMCFGILGSARAFTAELNSITAQTVDNLPDPTAVFADPTPDTTEAAETVTFLAEQRQELAKKLAALIQCGTCPLIETCKQLQGE
jgi:hypothetical protein